MNTSQLKKFAQEARKKLIILVSGKLEAVTKYDSAEMRGKAGILNKLNKEIQLIGKKALIEKVAYTWFNRFVALRFMDANDFQPLGINVLSPPQGMKVGSPQILSDIQAGHFHEELYLDRLYITDLLNGKNASTNPDNDIYRHILVAVCNDLHRIFPFLFEKIDDYSELLLPDDLTSAFSIIADIVSGMSAEDCAEVEIIGWLYQFYISEKKDEVFASKSKVKKEDIPAATQLFTPRWIVEYMVQNTVGKLWMQNHPESSLKKHMPYYIESPEGNTIDCLKISSAEEIKLLDQACGSGHILVYGFELLAKIYEEQGYSPSEIPAKIIENNLYGLEIDERAAQLAAFAITMKSRQYYRRFFRNAVVPKITCFEDIAFNIEEIFSILQKYGTDSTNESLKYDLSLLDQATNLGSLIQPHSDLVTLKTIYKQSVDEGESTNIFWEHTQQKLQKALKQLIPLAEKYHCVVDNPPYMGGGNMNIALGEYVGTNYSKSKADLMACFMEAGIAALQPYGYLGMINQHSWMFISSYQDLRKHLIDTIHFDTLLHLGPRTFPEIGGEVVQNAAFTFVNNETKDKGTYLRLIDFGSSDLKKQKTLDSVQNSDCEYLYTAHQNDFKKIPGSNTGYWLGEKFIDIFSDLRFGDYAKSNGQNITGNNNRFIRFFWEVSSSNPENKKWSLIARGGGFRKWYGNVIDVIDWSKTATEHYRKDNISRIVSEEMRFRDGITWSYITSSQTSFRKLYSNQLFEKAGPSLFFEKEIFSINQSIAWLNSKVALKALNLINPTLNYQVRDIQALPINKIILEGKNLIIEEKGTQNILISKKEWDSRESSSDFTKNEIIRFCGIELQSALNSYKDFWNLQFKTLHQNEEELNLHFIEIYGLQDELSPKVLLSDITILKEELLPRKVKSKKSKEFKEGFDNTSWSQIWSDLEKSFRKSGYGDLFLPFDDKELISQLISYAVGCIFGRYSLDKEGLILANKGETLKEYLEKISKTTEELKFIPDEDNVISLLEEEWFDDDIVNRVKEFVHTVWGDTSYQNNLQYIETILGKDLRKYLIKDFYKDHIKRYKKRPIYWQFSSPKGHFNVLIYMHRYTTDSLNFILNSYLRPFMEKVGNDIKRQEDIIITGSAVEQGKARKRQDKLKEILKDCTTYEYDILYPLAGERIAIDLDDGVLVNYNKFGNAIAPVPGLNDAKTKKKVKEFDWIDTSTIR